MVFIMGFLLPGVNNWAHAGGFIGGWLVASWQGAGMRRESSGVQILAIACAVASVLAIIVTPIIILAGIR
jgi:rhomboid protease GluP